MKRILLLTTISWGLFNVQAQQVIDSVSLGAGYANPTWYSLENDEQGSAPKDNWDIAFETSGFGTSIMINSVAGIELWLYPGDTADFTTLDTTGIGSWNSLYNSDTSWSYGAFSQNQTSSVDLGWGIYNTTTHIVTGDSLYVIKLQSGEYQKIKIITLSSGVYTFRHATLDNNTDVTETLTKSNYSGKNFGYFDLENDLALDREPASADWDLLFTQYIGFIPVPYGVSGVLHNYGVEVAEAYPINDISTYTNYSAHTFETAINTIGWDWKSYDFTNNVYIVQDSLIYFVKPATGDIWKMIFTGFGGSANGNYYFTKEKIFSVGIEEVTPSLFMDIYPNPANGQVNLVYDNVEGSEANLYIHDLSGKQVKAEQLTSIGLTTKVIDVSQLKSGIYFTTLQTGELSKTSKLIIK